MSPSEAFDDADDLQPRDVSDGDLASTLTSLLRADLSGTRPGAVASALNEASKDRARLLLALADALHDGELIAWIEANPTVKQRALALAKSVAPRDPGASHNSAAVACFRGYRAWQSAAYRMIIVPGYTPLDQKEAKPGVHPVARRRLEMAVEDHRAGKAPFILVSGANVYPRGTPYYEAIEMKSELSAMGVPPERVLVEARARHTTTNLRNAGRIMRQLGVTKALVITKGGGIGGSDVFGQDFYLANPDLSTFHGRCHRELGYQVGVLRGVGDGRIEFEVSAHVDRPSYDPLDP